MGNEIMKTDPRLDAFMIEMGKVLDDTFTKRASEIGQMVGLDKSGTLTWVRRACSMGETREVMYVFIVTYSPSVQGMS